MAYTLPSWANAPSTATPLTAANLTLANTAIADLDARVGRMVVSVKDYGAVGDGSNDDTSALNTAKAAALSSGVPLYLPPGTYKITSRLDWTDDTLVVIGAGAKKTVIRQHTGNTAILRTGGEGQLVEGIRLRYNTAATSSDTASNALEIYKGFASVYRRIEVEQAGRGIYLPTSLGLNNVFSCTISDIHINGYAISAVDLTATSSYSTGNVVSNVYTHNNFGGTPVASSAECVRLENCDEMVINQLNIEHCLPGGTGALYLKQCKNTVVSGLHCEGITLPSAGGFVRMYDTVKFLGQGVTVTNNTVPASMGVTSMFKVGGDNCYLAVSGLNLNSNTVSTSGTTHTLVAFDAAQASGSASVVNAELGDFAQLVANESSPPTLRTVNERSFTGLFARKTADQTVNNSTTLVDDTHLTVPVAASAVYDVDGLLFYSAATAADLKMQFIAPTGAVFSWVLLAQGSGATATSQFGSPDFTARLQAANAVAGGINVGTKTTVPFRGVLVMSTTAGAFKLQWAQFVADATDTVVYTHSYLNLRRVA